MSAIFSGCCRLCLWRTNTLVSLFVEDVEKQSVALKINAIFPFSVKKNDSLPKTICPHCVYKIEVFYEFFNSCIRSNNKLKKYLENRAPMSPCIYVEDGYDENTTTKLEVPETDPIDLEAIQEEMVYINLPNHYPTSLHNTNGLSLNHEGHERELIAAENNKFYEDDMECKGSSALLHEQSFSDSVPGPSRTPTTSMYDASKEKFFCNVCLQKFRSISLLNQHLCATVDLKAFSCVYCDVTISGTEEALEHAKLHNVAPFFVCTICNDRFDTDETLKCHAKVPCVKESINNDHRYASMRVSPDRSYSSKEMKTCCTCKRDFKGAAAYGRHLKSRVHRSHTLCKSRSSERDHDKTNDHLKANDGVFKKKVTFMSPENSQKVYTTQKTKRVRRTRFSDNSWIVGQHKRKYIYKLPKSK